MSVTYSVTVRNNRLQQVVNAIDAGVGNGLLKVGTSSMASVLSTITFVKPCGTISSGILTFSGLPIVDGSAAGSGTAVAAQITDSAGTVVVSGLTVSSAAGDIIIDNSAITVGDTVTLLSATITGN